jgi:hypothetical protein
MVAGGDVVIPASHYKYIPFLGKVKRFLLEATQNNGKTPYFDKFLFIPDSLFYNDVSALVTMDDDPHG